MAGGYQRPTILQIRGPESEVIPEKLHDERAVLVGLFGKRVELSNGIVKRLLGKVASTVRRVQNLVVEHREVEGQTKTNRVRRRKLGLGNVGGSLVRVVGLVGSLLLLVANRELGQVPVVVALPVVSRTSYRSET